MSVYPSEKEYVERLCDSVRYLAAGWNKAVKKGNAKNNKTRILCELDSAEDGIKEIRRYIAGLKE